MTRNKSVISNATDLNTDVAAEIDSMFPYIRSRSAKIGLLLRTLKDRDKEIAELKRWLEIAVRNNR